MILEAQSLEDQLDGLEKEDRIERLLEDLKSRQPRLT
jgi:phage shock protein A